MAGGSLGSLVVSLEANIARFESDLGRAEKVAKSAFDSIARAGDIATTAAKSLGLAIAGLSAGVGISTLVSKFESVTESLANLKTMSEKTGASVESLSAIAGVAKITGESLQTVETGMEKLAKSLSGATDESKGAAHALETLGLSADRLRQMDTGEAYKAIADKLGEYRDGLGKTALAQDIFGKSGAEQLPILKALAESGDLVAKSTTEQADQAKEYERTLRSLTATKEALYKIVAVQVIPVISDFIKVLLEAKEKTTGLQDKAKDLAKDGSIKEWAQDGALAAARLLDVLHVLAHGFEAAAIGATLVGKTISAIGTLGAIAVSGSWDDKKTAYAAFKDQAEKDLNDLSARSLKWQEDGKKIWSQYYDEVKASFGTTESLARKRAQDDSAKPSLDGYVSRLPKDKAAATGKEASPFDTYVLGLDRMLEKLNQSEFAAMHLRLEQLADAEAIDKNSARYADAADKIEKYHKAIDKQQLDQYTE